MLAFFCCKHIIAHKAKECEFTHYYYYYYYNKLVIIDLVLVEFALCLYGKDGQLKENLWRDLNPWLLVKDILCIPKLT